MTTPEPTPTAQYNPEIIKEAVNRVIQRKFHEDFRRITDITRKELLPHIGEALRRASREGIYQELTGGIIPSDEELREIIRNALPEEIRNKEKTETDQDQVDEEEAVEGKVTEADTAEQEGEGEVVKDDEEKKDVESPDDEDVVVAQDEDDEKDTEEVDLKDKEGETIDAEKIEDKEAPDAQEVTDAAEGEESDEAGDADAKAASDEETKDEKKSEGDGEKTKSGKIADFLKDWFPALAALPFFSETGPEAWLKNKAQNLFGGNKKFPRIQRRNFMKKGKGKGRTINGIPVEQMPNRGYVANRRSNKFNAPAANEDIYIDKAA